MPPAAPFLGRQEMEERTGQRGFPLCDSPTPVGNSTRSSARLATCLRTARYRLDVRVPTTSWRVPSHGIARRRCRCIPRFVPTLGGCIPRRDGRGCLSVLPETRQRPTHSRSRSQAAIADFLSSARRRSISRHAGGIPKGKALWSLLPTSGEAEVGPRRDSAKIPTNSDLSDRTNFGNGFSLDIWPG